jgi:hypothetical protein
MAPICSPVKSLLCIPVVVDFWATLVLPLLQFLGGAVEARETMRRYRRAASVIVGDPNSFRVGFPIGYSRHTQSL